MERLRAARAHAVADATTAGLGRQLAEALTPRPPLPDIPLTRVKILEPIKVTFKGKYGPEEFSGASGGVRDIPTALLRKQKGRVEVVPPDTEVIGCPLEPWMRTDD